MMNKLLLISISILLVIPNFIHKDINGQLPYDQKERFYPELTRINSIDKLEKYVDAAAALNKIDINTTDYTSILAYIISCRFYHGFSHWKLNENWIAAVGEKVIGMGLASKVEPDKIMLHPNAACSQQALVMMEILRRKKISYRKIGFPHHYALEAKINGHWYYFDPNMEPNISTSQRLEENWKGSNDSLKKYYNPIIHNNLNYQFGKKQLAEIGAVNEIPAQRAKLFQSITAVLSKILWCLPLAFVFSGKRKPKMYAVKPVNHFPRNKTFHTVFSA